MASLACTLYMMITDNTMTENSQRATSSINMHHELYHRPSPCMMHSPNPRSPIISCGSGAGEAKTLHVNVKPALDLCYVCLLDFR